MEEQSYKTHRKFVPAFHFVAFGIFVLNLVWAVWRLFQGAGLPLPTASGQSSWRPASCF